MATVVVTFTDGSKAPADAMVWRGIQFYTEGAAGRPFNSWIRRDRIKAVELTLRSVPMFELRVR